MAAYAAAASLRKTLSRLLSDQQSRFSQLHSNPLIGLLEFGVYFLKHLLDGNRDVEREAQDINSHIPSSHFFSPSEADISNQHIRALDRGLYNLQRFLDENRDVDREFEIQCRDAINEAQDIDSHMPSSHFVSPPEADITNQHIRALDRELSNLQRFLDENRDVDREFEIQCQDAIDEAQDIDSHMPSSHFVSPSEADISNQHIRALDRGLYNLQRFLVENIDVDREFEIQCPDAINEAQDIDSHMPSSHFVSPSKADISNQHIRALDDGLNSVQCFLDENRDVDREFEIQIRDAIYEAEDVIDSHLAHFNSPSEAEISNPSFCSELERLVQSINSIVEMTKSEEFNHGKISKSVWKTSEEIKSAKWHKLVGRMEDLVQLLKRLVEGPEELELVSIIGIAGVGKSNLVELIFEHTKFRERFDVCGLCKVPTEYKKRDVLLDLFVSMHNRDDEIHQMTDDQLAKHFYDFLKNKKYVVCLDDVRDIAVWNDLKESFPNHYNGSRILITTRDEAIADIAKLPYRLDPLSNEDTLDLLQQIVFGKERCRDELLEIAKDIAQSCGGLPRAVVIVGRLLRSANWSRKYWELVLSSIVTCDGYADLVEALVSLTYNHLPHNLRAFLLYMSMFPYGYIFRIFDLMHLWISEGFLKMDLEYRDENSEMRTAAYYVGQLESRGLLHGMSKLDSAIELDCRIADEVFHDFSMRTAKEENFYFIISKDTKDGSLLPKEDDSHNQLRRLFISKSIIPLIIQDFPQQHNLLTSISTLRSLLYYGPEHQYPLRPWLEFNLLKVLDILKIRFYSFPPEILKLLELRYLSLSYNGQLPAEVCKLRNLQFLIVSRYLSVKYSGAPSYLPVEIWNMKELRILQVMGSDIPLNTNLMILEKLFSLLDVSAHSCSRQIFERLPYLRELGVRIESLPEDESLSFFSHLNILGQLRGFKCVVVHPNIGPQFAPCSIPAFPGTLVDLTLSGCGFPWEHMRVIAALPKLGYLKLQNYAFQGPVWEVKKDEFPCLSALWLEDVDLEDWILADESCFPKMTNLFVKHCYKLHKIPDAKHFPKLGGIEVVNCNTSATESIEAIKQNLRDRNPYAQIVLYSPRDD